MRITIKELAEFVGGKVIGNGDLEISNIAKIEDALPGDLTFLYLPSYEKYFENTKASALIVKPDFNAYRNDLTYILAEQPDKAFFKILISYFKPQPALKGIDATASISPIAVVGNNVALGKNVVISDGCVIGDNTVIYHNSVLLENVTVGSDTLIYPNVSIRENCKVGSRVILHSGAVIGADGFGYTQNAEREYVKIPQIGNVVLEDDVEIGAHTTIDRAAMGSTVIGRGTKIDNLVQIAHNVTVGRNTAISAQTGVSGSSKIGDNCILAGQCGIVGHIELTDGVIITAQSGVSKNLKKPGMYHGSPVKEHRDALRQEAHIRNLPAYAERIKALENQISELKKYLEEGK